MPRGSRWANRFIAGALVQGMISFVIMSVLLYLALFGRPAVSRIVAAGGAGTWFTVGLIGYALIGVLGIAVSALFYHHIEVTLAHPYRGWRNIAAWMHLVLGGAAASAAALLTAFGGLMGGSALVPAAQGGWGADSTYVHENVLGPLVVPIAGLIGLGLLGFFIGGVGYVTAWWSAVRSESPTPS